MEIKKLKLGSNRTNTYILKKNKKCILIDCPSDSSYDIDKINNEIGNNELLGILYTHNHFDHVAGGWKFDVPQFMHPLDIESLGEQIEFGKNRGYSIEEIPNVTDIFNIPQEIKGIFEFEIIETPGHTKGGISILFENDGVIFTGDTLFKHTYGRTDLKYSNDEEMEKSLKKLLYLNSNLIIYPGHGHNSTIVDEKNFFRF